MPEQKPLSPSEAVAYLNKRLQLDPPLDVRRLNTLRVAGRVPATKIGTTNTSIYTRQALDRLTVQDLRDKRKKVNSA